MQANAKRNVPASMTSTAGAPSHAISAPAIAGPITIGSCVAPPKSADAFETSRSSSPKSSGMISRCDVMYGAVKMPSRKTITSSAAKDRWPVQWSSGTSAISGARSASERSIVVRAPSRPISEPLGMPSSAIGAISTASTRLMCAGEPVVTSTNHGSATNVIARAGGRDDLGDDERGEGAVPHGR